VILIPIFFVLIAFYLSFCGWDNQKQFKKVPEVFFSGKKTPMISICIPARNEEFRLGPCLESFLLPHYPNYEVLVLDDQSTDGTYSLAKGFSKKNKRFKILKGKPLPKGWVGKPWACHQLSLAARGEWIFFTDADTWHHPDMLIRTLRAAETFKADLVSCFTRQETVTWMEKLIIPVMIFCLISFLPARWVVCNDSFFSRFAGAGGQFLFFRRTAYEAIGGHFSVREQIVEDLNIGRRLVQEGFKLVILDGTELSWCRMYRSTREVWEGFSKNFFPAFGFSIPRALGGYFFLLAVGLLPFVLLVFTKPGSLLFESALAIVFIQLALRLNHAWRYHLPILSAVLHPIGCSIFVLIGFNSMKWYLGKNGGVWKNRSLRAPS